MESFTISSCIRSYHVYKGTWTPDLTEVLSCRQEPGNIHDPYAVAVFNSSSAVVGHVPHTISTICSLFLLRGGTITCIVNGAKKYSADLPQGGLELLISRVIFSRTGSFREISEVFPAQTFPGIRYTKTLVLDS